MPLLSTLHASAVAVGHRGVLITGASGSGKSSLALQLMALGATLVADDRVQISCHDDDALMMNAPARLAGLVEARGVGILAAPHVNALAVLHVDLDKAEEERLPPLRHKVIQGVSLTSLRRVESTAFPAMIMAYLHGGRAA